MVFGLLAIAAIPAGVLAAQFLARVPLLRALYVSVGIALVCGIFSWVAARRARLARARSVTPSTSRWPQVIAWAALYVGLTGALALGVYGTLRGVQ
ncbi:MAG: hypothetical protein H0X39_13400 [Actinobacteria bacterium]|nr:hypothetical protein [Actinomycetota bacterium]